MEQVYKYMVCTRCFTFNHAPYIEDVLCGFAMQETTFPVVYCIVDDASTDGVQEVLKKWAGENLLLEDGKCLWAELPYGKLAVAPLKNKHEHTFVILLLAENYHCQHKSKIPFISEWMNGAKYQALCEGDDYWIDPLKLQKQVDYLETHADCGLVYTRARIYDVKGNGFKGYVGERRESLSELLLSNTIPTLTAVYKSEIYYSYLKDINPKKQNWLMGDYPLWLYISANSEIHYIEEVTAVYRVMPESASHSSDYNTRLAFLDSTYQVRLFFAERYAPELIDLIIDNNNRQLYLTSLSSSQSKDVDTYFHAIHRPSLIDVLRYLKYKVFSIFRK